MMVIADTSSLNYLVLIGQIDILRELYGSVTIPEAVFKELQHPRTPAEVTNWLTSNPSWLFVQAVKTPLNAELLTLNQGEAEAIALAEELMATTLIIDEREGRKIALQRGLPVTGLLGVLRDAADRNLLDLPQVFSELGKTTFRAAPKLLQTLLDEYLKRKGTS